MSLPEKITFVVAANNADVLNANLLRSPCLSRADYQILVQWNFKSASEAYNDAIDKSANDLIVFAHQDIYFPESWLSQFARSLKSLSISDPDWGVLGCYGTAPGGSYRGYLYSSCQQIHGRPFDAPAPVQTLDEIVLIFRKSSGLRFDINLPHFHLYGADICLAAAQKGLKSYAVYAPCIHNTQQNLVLPREFYDSCAYLRKSRKEFLPIWTTCVRITRHNRFVYMRRLQELYLRHIRKKTTILARVPAIETLLNNFRSSAPNHHF